MRAVNHALTGAFIGLTIVQPAVAVPAALVSHFVLDAIPHYDAVPSRGHKRAKLNWLRSKAFRWLLYADAALCVALVGWLDFLHPQHWLLAVVCAFVAAAPDLVSAKRYFLTLRHKQHHPSRYEAFAGRIQWFEKPIGAVVELAWFIGVGVLLLALLKG